MLELNGQCGWPSGAGSRGALAVAERARLPPNLVPSSSRWARAAGPTATAARARAARRRRASLPAPRAPRRARRRACRRAERAQARRPVSQRRAHGAWKQWPQDGATDGPPAGAARGACTRRTPRLGSRARAAGAAARKLVGRERRGRGSEPRGRRRRRRRAVRRRGARRRPRGCLAAQRRQRGPPAAPSCGRKSRLSSDPSKNPALPSVRPPSRGR